MNIIEISDRLSHIEQINEVIQELSASLSTLGCEVKIQISPVSNEPLPQSENTTLAHYYLRHRREGKKMVCQSCGRIVPTTPQGEIDQEKLMRENYLLKY